MSHLSTDRLAALSDETPTAAELAHLSMCDECARERAAFRSVAGLAGAATDVVGMPLTSWETLRPALIADGIIDTGHGMWTRSRRPWLRAAAAVLLVSGGVALGRFSATGSILARNQVAANSTGHANASSPDSVPTFTSVDEAVAAQSRAQLVYQSALAFIAQHDTTSRAVDSPAAIRTRLAALDETGQVLSEARQKAPYDPVINGYYLTTMGQREATLRQLNTVMPASMQITSY